MELRKRLLFAVGLLIALIAISVTGYRVLGGDSVTFLQALYMAVITLAGVGYGEIVDTSHNPALRIFNIGIVLFGVAITVYVFSVVAAFLVEVEVTNPFWRRRMQKRISELSNHFVVCGLGDTGRYAVAELQKTNTPYVVVDICEDNLKKSRELHAETLQEVLYVIGDATEEDTLEKAGIERRRRAGVENRCVFAADDRRNGKQEGGERHQRPRTSRDAGQIQRTSSGTES